MDAHPERPAFVWRKCETWQGNERERHRVTNVEQFKENIFGFITTYKSQYRARMEVFLISAEGISLNLSSTKMPMKTEEACCSSAFETQLLLRAAASKLPGFLLMGQLSPATSELSSFRLADGQRALNTGNQLFIDLTFTGKRKPIQVQERCSACEDSGNHGSPAAAEEATSHLWKVNFMSNTSHSDPTQCLSTAENDPGEAVTQGKSQGPWKCPAKFLGRGGVEDLLAQMSRSEVKAQQDDSVATSRGTGCRLNLERSIDTSARERKAGWKNFYWKGLTSC
ncbi:hypothetical protein CCH79_00009938 [Gambusia affinis]|uniref:Somatostatin/Cortistatin C-terminal domain-containing protein n=1 Tax=Gambusia affinis TaxID=33528 RepID=A0A315V5P3_GAMAF|nr:hypothetical protein CCH79_00009938 [Gambusia affinis]